MSSPDEPEAEPEVRLKDLRAGLPPVHILARVLTVSRREVTSRTDGRRRSVLSGLLSDGTATVRFTWWDPPGEGVDPGTVLRAVNAQVREYREQAELSFGWSTRIQPASDLELPVLDPSTLPLRPVSQLTDRDGAFRIEVRVLDVTPRTVTVGEERRSIHSGHVADGSGAIPFTAWVDFRLAPGDTIRVIGGYVRRYRGLPELTLDARSHIEALPPGSVPPTQPAGRDLAPLGVAEGATTGSTVSVEGTVVGLAAVSGLVRRCPTCSRVLHAGVCRTHGAVEGLPDLRARIVLDDGTGVATVNLPREATERLGTVTLAEAVEMARTQPDGFNVEHRLRAHFIGRRFRVTGVARVDEFGLSIQPAEISPSDVEPQTALERLGRVLAERNR